MTPAEPPPEREPGRIVIPPHERDPREYYEDELRERGYTDDQIADIREGLDTATQKLINETPRPVVTGTPYKPEPESPAMTATMGLIGLACVVAGGELFRDSIRKLRKGGHSLGGIIRHAEKLATATGETEHVELEEPEDDGGNS